MKKFLFIVPAVLLLAAGCNNSVSGTGDQPSGQNSGYNQNSTPSDSGSSSTTNSGVDNATTTKGSMMNGQDGSSDSAMMNGSMWQSTLQASNDSTKGNYMIMSGGHTIYLKTSQDYSMLVGQPVTVNYSGTMDSFKLGSITAQSAMQDQIMKK